MQENEHLEGSSRKRENRKHAGYFKSDSIKKKSDGIW